MEQHQELNGERLTGGQVVNLQIEKYLALLLPLPLTIFVTLFILILQYFYLQFVLLLIVANDIMQANLKGP
jgi:hypothetical protein